MTTLNRDTAVELLNKYVTTEHIITHSYAVEAVMSALAEIYEPENKNLWAVAGLLHDLDNDFVDWPNEKATHGPKSIELLKQENYGNEILYDAILAHNPATGKSRDRKIEKAIYAADPITGFIRATTLVYPDQKINKVKVKSIHKRMKDSRFAAGADREAMRSIETLGMDFKEFSKIALEAMCEISDTLNL